MTSLLERVRRFLPRTGPLASGLGLRIALGIAVVVIAAPPLIVETPPVGLKAGTPAPRTYRANRQIQFEDTEATAKLRTAAANAVAPVVALHTGALPAAQRSVDTFYRSVAGLPAAPAARAGGIRALAQGSGVSEGVVQAAAALDENGLADARRVTGELVAAMMTSRFTAEDLSDVRLRLHETAAVLPLDAMLRDVVAAVGDDALVPTLQVDEQATGAAQAKAADAVPPVLVVKQAGENIVVRGEIVTARHLDILASLGQIRGGGDPRTASAIVGLLALIVLAAGMYVFRYERGVWDRMRLLAVVATLFVGMIGVTRLMLWLFPEASPHLMPVPLTAMLATLLVSPSIGVLLALLTSAGAALLGLSAGPELVALFVSSLVAIVAMSSLGQRRHLVYAGLLVIGATGASAAVGAFASGGGVSAAAAAGGQGVIGGLMSAVLAYGLLPFFEYAFGVTTDVRLLELSSPGAPLLRELMSTAPGTYSHSVLAGSLAETAADAIGANPLLARVGAYYHDIGKMNRPVFFAENLAGEQNPHDEKTPWLSASIITAHVREGVEIAVRHRLPREVVDIIRQHHGDSLVSYFYSKAAEGGEKVHESDFRYSAQRPQSPEAALVMLADSVEAAMRAIRGPSLPEVESAVRQVVREKVDDGQLDESDLTLADVETIVRVYAKMLVSIYHPRVKYPQCPVRRTQDAGQRYEPSRS